MLHQQGANTLDGASYTYDSAGNRKSKTNPLNSTTSNFSYDNVYQLIGVTGPNPESYSYDAVGNRLTSQTVLNYAYNSSNELTAVGSASYTYDDDGNTLSKTDSTGTTRYTWDFENRLTSVQLPHSTVVTFKYDPFGRRIQKNGAGTTSYVYDGANGIEEVDQSGNLLARYSQGAGIDEPLSELRSGATSYYQQDGLGSVTSLSSLGGALADTYVYDSFGNLNNFSGAVTNPYQYTGRDYDQETGLRYYRARYVDSSSGRFLNEDPIGFAGGHNFYAYVRNNPQNWSDPSGLRFDDAQCRAIEEILRRERKYGTHIAALMSGVSSPLSDGLLGVFNSTYVADFQTPLGMMNLDWFTDLEASQPGFLSMVDPNSIPFLRYGNAKVLWILTRALHFPGAPPVTNYVPYSRPGETNAAWQATKPWIGYKDIFTPEFVKKECPKGCLGSNK